MEFVDTHAHLYDSQFDADRQQTLQRAAAAGVTRLLLPDVDAQSRGALDTMAEQCENCYPMVGLHPTSVNDNPAWRQEIATIGELLTSRPNHYCAVGEIGLDLYWSRDFESEQRAALSQQIELALEHSLPVAIHCRDAWAELIDVLTPFASKELRGVIHAFSGTIEHYHTLRTLGDFKFGIGGVVTFKKSALAPVVAQMALEDILLETDAPYLTPTPYRGKRNESSYIPLIAQAVADLHAVPIEKVASVTTASAVALFNL